MASVTATGPLKNSDSKLQGFQLYETQKAVHEYLQFHYATSEDVMPYARLLTGDSCNEHGLAFPHKLAHVCKAHAPKASSCSVLDLGCAVGGSSFTLATFEQFERVVGVDFSESFVTAARSMQTEQSATYQRLVEGDSYEMATAKLTDVQKQHAHKCQFFVGDACTVTAAEAGGEPFDVILMANLLCRVPDPAKLLANAKALLRRGGDGVVVIASPYSWTEAFTQKDRWVGGYDDESGKFVDSDSKLRDAMAAHGFELVETTDMPFVIREHRRKFQLGISSVHVYVLR
uniref:Methyltransferase type 11 domain-containing protein n=1 Tax=Pycnococcus provasolii TaxID=41880 RepID=A0A7S2AW30_9CHLO|eukprot:CAMPEP_0119194460 /NCGR_PEP_ID=MMETSP1316-20130426/4235_1 /TAXON_ID=41880 /ORGANISM="Pycnococcus provasolii, Strain RCC2336" /LENGTH=287 /DNA_ID=CAMNT_0007189797 /DNA_START=13 /DNA_END=876 /DNA_ORIENTATION=+